LKQLPEQLIQEMKNKLVEWGLTGPNCGHERRLNLKAVRLLQENNEKATFGLEGGNGYTLEELLSFIADCTQCSSDITKEEGAGFIEPQATWAGFYEAAEVLAGTAKKKGKVILGTGHPGSMTAYYLEMARLLEDLGCQVLSGIGAGMVVDNYLCPHCGQHDVQVRIDYVGKVAFLSDGEILRHTHSAEPMEIILNILAQEGCLPDLVIGDHGFAGAGIKKGLPTIAVMDTNDPALALAKRQGADLVIIPMDDNRPNYLTAQAVELLAALINCCWEGLGWKRKKLFK